MNERVDPDGPGDRLTAREMLRAATRDAHRRVDTSPLMRRLLAPDVSLRDYQAALSALAAAHQVLCPAIARAVAPRPHPQLDARQLLAPLLEDLEELGGPVSVEVTALEADIDGFAAGHGAWYVLEGAALGGAVIARRMSERIGTALPLRHFSGAGRSTDRWAVFSAYIESALPSERQRHAAVDGARAAFRCVEALVSTGVGESAP